MKVAVAGSTGVLGRHLIPRLIENGHQVLALARSQQKAGSLLPDETEIVSCDLLDTSMDEKLPFLLDGCDAVIHAATAIPEDLNAPGAWDNNTRLRTEGTERLIKAALKKDIKKYLQQSIVMAYPDMGDRWISEDMALDDSDERKQVTEPVRKMEALVQELSNRDVEWCILRGGVFTGKHTFQERTVLQLENDTVPLQNGGIYFVSYVHVADMAEAFVLALEKPVNGVVLNICDEPNLQIDYLHELAQKMGVPFQDSKQDDACPPSHRCSNQKAKEKLGWRPVHGIFHDIDQLHKK